jgi:hypothetical protein
MHRFIEIEGDELRRRSPLFTFDHSGVEYAAGMLIEDGKVIVTHSVEESSARWKMFDWCLVNDLLNGELP